MNNKGFTLVELLASLVILGVLMAITIPNVVGIISQSKTNNYRADAEKMISTAKYKFSADSLYKPQANECIVITLSYLGESKFDNPPNEGQYLMGESFVIVKREGKRFNYYVRLVEKTKADVKSGVNLVKEADLEKVDEKDTVKIGSIEDALGVTDLNAASVSASSLNGKAPFNSVCTAGVKEVYKK